MLKMFLVSCEHVLHFKQMKSIKMFFIKLSLLSEPTHPHKGCDSHKRASIQHVMHGLVTCDLVKKYNLAS